MAKKTFKAFERSSADKDKKGEREGSKSEKAKDMPAFMKFKKKK